MWFDPSVAARLSRLALRPDPQKDPGLRRHASNFLLPHLFFAGLQGGLRGLQGLDRALYPAYREVPIREPFLIFANARSGTTLLHHLMSLDEERFAAMKMHHTVFPSVSVQKLVGAAHRLDQKIGAPLESLVAALDAHFFRAWEGIHTTGLRSLEEDEALFTLTLLSPGVLFVYPHLEALEKALWVDRLDPQTKATLAKYYVDAVQRFLYAEGRGRQFLNKSIWYPARIRFAYETFPDMRFVYVMRHPYETLPSFLNFFYAAWKVFYPEMRRDSAQVQRFARLAVDYYRYAFEELPKLPENQRFVLQFDSLIADPVAAVESIYAHFGMDLSPRYAAKLRAAVATMHRFQSKRKFRLEDFGVSKESVYRPLKDLFDAYGYASGLEGSVQAPAASKLSP